MIDELTPGPEFGSEDEALEVARRAQDYLASVRPRRPELPLRITAGDGDAVLVDLDGDVVVIEVTAGDTTVQVELSPGQARTMGASLRRAAKTITQHRLNKIRGEK